MNTPEQYDPITLNHWLWFRVKCHESTPTEFQRLFEQIMYRYDKSFVQVRSYGNIGDRKCDGLLFGNDEIFQVYSPDSHKLAELQAKIEEDLSGALKHWHNLKRWTFVYNSRGGLPADVPKQLQEKEKQYPSLKIELLSNDILWERARTLPIQTRAEVLGAPAGYEYLFLAPSSTPDEMREILYKSWFVIVQDTMSPISLSAVAEALKPDLSFGPPTYVRPDVSEFPWHSEAEFQRVIIKDLLQKARHLNPRFAIFSFSQIPLAVHLGFVLSDRVQLRCYQHHRDDRTSRAWNWPDIRNEDIDFKIDVAGIPEQPCSDEVDVAIKVSLTNLVDDADCLAVAGDVKHIIHISVDKPSVLWLRHPDQLAALENAFRNVLTAIRSKLPNCRAMHLFYAGPTGGAVVIGQQFNPRMDPPVLLYQYSRQTTPRYQHALTVTEAIS